MHRWEVVGNLIELLGGKMVSKGWGGIGREHLLKIGDGELKRAIFSPTFDDILKGSVIALLLLSVVALYGVFISQHNTTTDEWVYSACTKGMPRFNQGNDTLTMHYEVPRNELCEEFNQEKKDNGIETEKEYFALKWRQELERRVGFAAIMFAFVGLPFIAGLLLKKANPFFLTSIQDRIELEIAEKKLREARIGKAKIRDSDLPLLRRGLILREYPEGIYILSFYNYSKAYMISEHRTIAPSAEKVALSKKDANDILGVLGSLENVKIRNADKDKWLAKEEACRMWLVDFN